MKNKDHIEDELELQKLAPTLFGIKKEEPFSVPENYFDNLSLQIRERCLEESRKTTLLERIFDIHETVAWWKYLLKPRVSLACATVLLLAFAGIRQIHFSDPVNVVPIAAETGEMSNSVLMEYIDEEVILDALSENSNTGKKNAPALDARSSEKKAMEEYLLNNDIDVTLISKEL